MKTQIIQEIEQVEAKIFRDSKDASNWALVAYPKMIKRISRSEGLEIKNKYGMRPYSANGFSMGYHGIIPKSLFTSGDKI